MKTATLIINASHLTKVRPTPNLHIPVTLTGRQKEIDGHLHTEVKIGKRVYWIGDLWIARPDNDA